MRKAGSFFKSIVPFLIAIALQLVVTIPLEIIYTIRNAGKNGEGMEGIIDTLTSSTTDASFLQTVNVIYGILGLIIFILWYQKVFVKPFRHKRKEDYPTGFSFHTIIAIIFLAVGLQYVTTFVVTIVANLRPDWLAAYNNILENSGYGDMSTMLILYTIILAPIVEETLFRGLIFRYARYALPFWLANIWQALLFGIMHMNFLQGIYAFVMGLFLGFICHRGRGIKYSIMVHIIFNLIGTCYSGLISFTTDLNYPIAVGLGTVLTIFALWLFYTDFTPRKSNS